jgi:hypothetical protein
MPNDNDFDPDEFHRQYVQSAGDKGAFDPDTFHAQYTRDNGAQVPPPQIKWDDEAPTIARPQESSMHKAISSAEDVGTGFLKGVGHTLGGLSPLINRIPYIGETLAPSKGIEAWNKTTEPKGTAQKAGYYGEQGAEFLLPTGVEEKGAAELATHLPALGRVAAPAARIATSALTSGAINRLQGGSFKGGALLGAGSGALGEVGRAIAPSMAESALGVTKKMRGFGRTPGRAALDEIGNSIRPATIAENAQMKINQLTFEMERRTAASTVPASTKRAVDIVDREQIKAIQKNSRARYDMLHGLSQQLTTEFHTGSPIPQQVTASRILDLKRGIGDLEKTWNPEQRTGIKPTILQVYRALDNELDRAVPGARELNQRISSLIPVAKRAESIERGADMGQRVAHRLGAHTGALAASGVGGVLGYEHGGPGEALIGGTAGLMLPELLSSPSVQMLGARALDAPPVTRIGRAAAAQLLPKRLGLTENPDDEKD